MLEILKALPDPAQTKQIFVSLGDSLRFDILLNLCFLTRYMRFAFAVSVWRLKEIIRCPMYFFNKKNSLVKRLSVAQLLSLLRWQVEEQRDKEPGMSGHGWPLINASDCTWLLSESWTGTRGRESRLPVEWPPGHHFKQYCAGTVVRMTIADSSQDAFPRRAGCLTLNLLTPKYFTRKEQLYPVKLRKTRDFISNVSKVILFRRNLCFWYLLKEAETYAFL